MKVLVVSNMYPERNPNFRYNGIFVKEQVDSLNKDENIDCKVFIIDGFVSKFKYLFDSLKLLLNITFNKYDVIHVHYGLSGLFMLFNPFKRKWRNVVVTLHGGDILSEQGKSVQVYLTKKIIKKARKVITLNEEMNSVVAKIRKDYTVAPCGVDTELFNSTFTEEKRTRFLFPGSPTRNVKNYPLFDQIVKEYQLQYGDIEIVTLDGFNRSEISDLLQNSTCLIMTSISEGSPQIIKEALSCDLPVISVDVGDVKFVLGNTPGTKIIDRDLNIKKIPEIINSVIQEGIENPLLRRKRIFDIGLSQPDVIESLKTIYREIV